MKHATLGSSSRHLFKRLRLDEPWHGNVLLSCGPHKLEPKQQLQEFNSDFEPRLRCQNVTSYAIALVGQFTMDISGRFTHFILAYVRTDTIRNANCVRGLGFIIS